VYFKKKLSHRKNRDDSQHQLAVTLAYCNYVVVQVTGTMGMETGHGKPQARKEEGGVSQDDGQTGKFRVVGQTKRDEQSFMNKPRKEEDTRREGQLLKTSLKEFLYPIPITKGQAN